MLDLTMLVLCSFQKCKIWKLGLQTKLDLKISETKLQQQNEIQALETAILGPPCQSMTVHLLTPSMDPYIDCQPRIFSNQGCHNLFWRVLINH